MIVPFPLSIALVIASSHKAASLSTLDTLATRLPRSPPCLSYAPDGDLGALYFSAGPGRAYGTEGKFFFSYSGGRLFALEDAAKGCEGPAAGGGESSWMGRSMGEVGGEESTGPKPGEEGGEDISKGSSRAMVVGCLDWMAGPAILRGADPEVAINLAERI